MGTGLFLAGVPSTARLVCWCKPTVTKWHRDAEWASVLCTLDKGRVKIGQMVRRLSVFVRTW